MIDCKKKTVSSKRSFLPDSRDKLKFNGENVPPAASLLKKAGRKLLQRAIWVRILRRAKDNAKTIFVPMSESF